MKKYLLVVIVIALASLLSRRFIFVTEAQRIRRVVNDARRALEHEQSDALMRRLAPEFRDDHGNDRATIKSNVDNFFTEADSIEIIMRFGSVRIDQRAPRPGALCSLRVRIFAQVEGEKGVVLGGIRPADVVLILVKNGREWVVSYAHY